MKWRWIFEYTNDDGVLCIGFKTPKKIPLVRVRYRTLVIYELPNVRLVRERTDQGL